MLLSAGWYLGRVSEIVSSLLRSFGDHLCSNSGFDCRQTCLFAKSTAELLKETFKGNNQLVYVVTWLIVVMMVFTIMMETVGS